MAGPKWYDPLAPHTRTELWLWELGRLRGLPEAVRILDRCLRRAEVEFAVAVIESPGWFCWDDASFANHDWILTPRAEIGRYRVSFVLRSRHDPHWSWAVDIFENVARGRRRTTDPAREDTIRAGVREYRSLEEGQVKGVAKHFRDLLALQASRATPLSLERYQQLITPGLVWIPLEEKFWFNASIGAPARQLRLYHWLRERGHTLSPGAVNVLAQCEWHAAVRFALPILQAGPWRFAGRRATDGGLGLEVKRLISRYEVDFVIGRLDSRTQLPTVVEIRKPSTGFRSREQHFQRMREQAARDAGYRYLLVEEQDAESEGKAWAELLTTARHERDDRSRRFQDSDLPEGGGDLPGDLSPEDPGPRPDGLR
jgi:hypothetical protein